MHSQLLQQAMTAVSQGLVCHIQMYMSSSAKVKVLLLNVNISP